MIKSHRLGKGTQLPKTSCTQCDSQLDTTSQIDGDASPSPGDVTVCLRCGHIMAFDHDMRMRELTDAEMIAIAGDEKLVALQWARHQVMNKGGKQ